LIVLSIRRRGCLGCKGEALGMGIKNLRDKEKGWKAIKDKDPKKINNSIQNIHVVVVNNI
jgi:hypothetical protein